jgi:hypothetical protein
MTRHGSASVAARGHRPTPAQEAAVARTVSAPNDTETEDDDR